MENPTDGRYALPDLCKVKNTQLSLRPRLSSCDDRGRYFLIQSRLNEAPTKLAFMLYNYISIQSIRFFLLTLLVCALCQNRTVLAQSTVTVPACDNITNPGTIGGEQKIQIGQTPTLLLEVAPVQGINGTQVRYQWMVYQQIGQMEGQWYPILGAEQATYQPGAITKTTRYMRCASKVGCKEYLSSNEVTITVSEGIN
jgi:hypothetical protein